MTRAFGASGLNSGLGSLGGAPNPFVLLAVGRKLIELDLKVGKASKPACSRVSGPSKSDKSSFFFPFE